MKLSFILPVYNVAPWLRSCLDSIQVADDVEVICVDDGSTDESGAILDEYAGRVRVVHQRNAGVSAARNTALALARGEYISFVDPDDLLREGAVVEMLRRIKEYADADIVSFANEQFLDGSAPTWPNAEKITVVDVSTSIREETMWMCVCGAVYKKKILPKTGFRPYCMGEDLVFVGECLCHAHKVVQSSLVLYGYRQRSGSATNGIITPRKLVDNGRYCRALIEVLTKSNRRVDPNIYRRLGLKMTEGYIGAICDLSTDQKRDFWDRWYDSLTWMKEQKVFPPWTTFVIKVCDALHFKFLVYFLCLWPLRLKQFGVHR